MSIQKKLLKELRQLDSSSLDERLISLKRELYLLGVAVRVRNSPVKVHLFSKIRKEIARVLTVKKEGLL